MILNKRGRMKKNIFMFLLTIMLFVLIGTLYFFSYGAIHFEQKMMFMLFFVPFLVLFLEVKTIKYFLTKIELLSKNTTNPQSYSEV